MPDIEDIHEALDNHEGFGEFIEKADRDETVSAFRGLIDGLGESTESLFELEPEEFTSTEIGWLRLAWEAHHKGDNHDKVETHQ